MKRARPLRPQTTGSSLLAEESGISLVELLVGMGIAAGIMTLIGTFIWQFFTVTRVGTNRMAVSSTLQSASLWLARDAVEASDYSDGVSPVYGTFSAPQFDSDHSYVYRYEAAEEHLVRDLYVDGSLDSSQVVARFIANEGDVTFTEQAGGTLVTLSITAAHGDATETIDLDLALRVP